MKIKPLITSLGRPRIILGTPWFTSCNPDINWANKTLTWRNYANNSTFQQLVESADRTGMFINKMMFQEEEFLEINTKILQSQIFTQQHGDKKEQDPIKIVPPEFHNFLDLFSEKKSERFPPEQPWDHQIEMLPTFVPKAFSPYKLTINEEEQLDKFIQENLAKGYIRPSKSPMASPFFFVAKKDGKLCPCQDYRYLNQHTKKNRYLILNIQSILDKVWGSHYSTTLDIVTATPFLGLKIIRLKEITLDLRLEMCSCISTIV